MRPERVIRFVVLNGLAVGLGAIVATSCINVDYPTVAFRCNPRQSDNCPDTHFCCSDDPASPEGMLPSYLDKGIDGHDFPFFSGVNNGLGTSGLCVRTGDIPLGSGLLEPQAANCPIPCNPKWDDLIGNNTIRDVCGMGRVCCQTVAMEATDCLPDNDGVWQPVTGALIGDGTNWGAGVHATHQDPGGTGCSQYARAMGGSGMLGDPIWEDCIAQLTVADQRGFCMALTDGQSCPVEQAGFINACDQINQGIILPPV